MRRCCFGFSNVPVPPLFRLAGNAGQFGALPSGPGAVAVQREHLRRGGGNREGRHEGQPQRRAQRHLSGGRQVVVVTVAVLSCVVVHSRTAKANPEGASGIIIVLKMTFIM